MGVGFFWMLVDFKLMNGKEFQFVIKFVKLVNNSHLLFN